MKSLFVICDTDGNPFFTDKKGKDAYTRVWAFKSLADAKAGCKTDKVVEYRPVKG